MVCRALLSAWIVVKLQTSFLFYGITYASYFPFGYSIIIFNISSQNRKNFLISLQEGKQTNPENN